MAAHINNSLEKSELAIAKLFLLQMLFQFEAELVQTNSITSIGELQAELYMEDLGLLLDRVMGYLEGKGDGWKEELEEVFGSKGIELLDSLKLEVMQGEPLSSFLIAERLFPIVPQPTQPKA